MKTKLVKVDEVKIQSLIKKNFSEEFMRKIYDVYSNDCISIVEKTIIFDELFTKEFGHRKDYRRIGEGTNRFVCLLDNHIIKVAYNYLAYIDNMNELAQAKYKSKYLAQAYETNGIILVSEYVTVMDQEDFIDYNSTLKKILDTLSIELGDNNNIVKNYILGDMGTSNKNYGNWGRRMNGDIVVLDYGYLYELTNEAWKKIARCPVCGSSLEYESGYSQLVCTKTDCHTEVKYTTLRNAFGYANIIDNIVDNLHDDRYIKFDANGEIMVDVIDKIVIEEAPKEEFKMPEDIKERIDRTMDQFNMLTDLVKSPYGITLDNYYDLKEEIISRKEEYDEVLYPFLLVALELTMQNVDAYIKDFEKFSKARYDKLFNELKKEFDKEQEAEEELEDLPDSYEDEEYIVKGYESELKIIDRVAEDENNKVISTSLDDFFTADFQNSFGTTFDAESDFMNQVESMGDELSMDDLVKLFEINERMEAEEKIKAKEEQEKQEKLDKDYKVYSAEKDLRQAYDDLEDALTTVIKLRYKEAGCLEEDESDYTTGDIYTTYLNGEFIDLDYSPRVNAKNILGGWKPNDFAFPLYRHMLIKFDYDMDKIESEFQAVYRIDEEVEVPEDLYDVITNRNMVVGQIMNRFEDSMKPPRHNLIMNIGGELKKYYEMLDKYYEVVQPSKNSVDINHPDYYLNIAEDSDQMVKMLREAKMELRDELLNEGYRLEGLLDDHKIVYYYDMEAVMSPTELNILDIITNTDFTNITNVKEHILNEYYLQYRNVLPDSVFDVFKYGGSLAKEVGCVTHPRIVRPRIKAKLVDIDSNEDTFKPEMFNKKEYVLINIELRYDAIFDTEIPDEITKKSELKRNLQRRNLNFTEKVMKDYAIKRSNDIMRYALTEKEIEIINEYEDMLSIATIKDVDKLVKKAIVDMLNEKHNMCGETKILMNDLAETNLTDAYANRVMKINILELSGATTRLDFLTHVE